MKSEDADAEVLKSVAVQLMTNGAVTLEGQELRVGKTSRQRLRTARFLMNGREYEAIEQNPEKPSRWGKLAAAGHQVVQFRDMLTNKYVAVAVDGEMKWYGGREMRLQLDHVTVCGSDLEAMRRAFREVGLSTTYGGAHANGVTHMDLLAFEDGSYLELIAPMAAVGGAPGMMSGWARLMEGNAGAGAWAVRIGDVHKEATRLRAAGIEVRGPEAGGRQRRDGSALEWETAIVGPGAAGSVLPFVIQDKTPRGLRVPEPSSSMGNSISGVAVVVLGVRDLDASVGLFRRAYGLEDPRIERREDLGITVAFFSGTPVMVAGAFKDDCWLMERIGRFGECPAAFLLGTRDLEAATDRYRLGNPDVWFGRKLAWFDESRLSGMQLGVIEV